MGTQTSIAIRLEQSATAVMEPTINGDYFERTIEGAHLWMCPKCRLVWQKRWHAEQCGARGHATSFEQGPYGCTGTLNGVPQGNLTYYTRSAVRREPK